MNFFLEEFASASWALPFEAEGIDHTKKTGSDIYTTMLAASLGGKSITALSCAGSCEVLTKVSAEYAQKYKVGFVKPGGQAKAVPSLDKEGTIVARTGSTFSGVKKASAFTVLMEATTWTSTAVTRVKNAATLAAALQVMGVSEEKSLAVAGDALGEEIPEDVVAGVVVPLSLAKKDAATTSKARSALFLPDHVIKTVVWDDTQLQTRPERDKEAVDWGRVTTVARYIGAVNWMLDPNFRSYATVYGVPYDVVNNHWATLPTAAYLALDNWTAVQRPPTPSISVLMEASTVASSAVEAINLPLSLYKKVGLTGEFDAILTALDRVRLPGPKTLRTAGSDVLNGVTGHTVRQETAHLLVKGSESSFNALVSAILAHVCSDRDLSSSVVKFHHQWKSASLDDEHYSRDVKLMADKLFTKATFAAATVELEKVLGSNRAARERMAKLRRQIFQNSSALHDNVVVTSASIPTLLPVLRSVAAKVSGGKFGHLKVPTLLLNPAAAIIAGKRAEMIKAATEYLNEAREFWGNSYERKSRAIRVIRADDSLAIRYSLAAKAMRSVTPQDLIAWQSDYVSISSVPASYLAVAVANYARKRSIVKVEPQSNETIREFARRADKVLHPRVTFESTLDFVIGKMAHLAGDFCRDEDSRKTFTAIRESDEDEYVAEHLASLEAAMGERLEEKAKEAEAARLAEEIRIMKISAPIVSIPEAAEADLSALDDFFGSGGGTISLLRDYNKAEERAVARSLWPDEYDPEAAAQCNGYASYDDALVASGSAVVYDPENEFTQKYLEWHAREVAANEQVAEGSVI
jgi:hypothetical protein